MLIDYELFKWLIVQKIVQKPENTHVRADGKIEVDSSVQKMIQNGTVFIKIIRILKKHAESTSQVPVSTPPNIKQIKDLTTPGARVYNWNIVCEALAKFNYNVPKEVKDLIVAGDEDMMLSTLMDVYKLIMRYHRLNPGKVPLVDTVTSDGSQNFPKGMRSMDNGDFTRQIQNQKAMREGNGIVNLDHIDIESPLEDTSSIMEFLIVSLSQCMRLNSKQSMSLLLQGNKYLAHVLVKGIKSDYEPIIEWYKNVYACSKNLLQLIVREQPSGSIQTAFNAFKPGLFSKNEDVAQWACRLLGKLAFDFSNIDLLPMAWEWFIQDNGGLFSCLNCLKRHQDLGTSVVATMTQFGRWNMLELFTVEMRKILVDPLDYLHHIQQMLRPLTEARVTKEELLSSSIVDFWIEYAMKNSDSFAKNSTPELRSASLSLLCSLWEAYPHKIEATENLGNQILSALKKAVRDRYSALRLTALTYLFKLLESFASDRNPFAPIVYKILTFTLFEHHENLTVREYILYNFINILNSYSTIPIGIVIEPFAKQISNSEGRSYVLNNFDFDFINAMVNHPKLGIKHAIHLLDVIVKIYLNNITFAHLAAGPLLVVVSRFIEDDTMQEYLVEFAKLAMSKYYLSVKKKKNKENVAKKFIYLADKDELYSGPSQITPEMEEEIINAQKRALIIDIFKEIIGLRSLNLNARYKILLVYTNSQLKQYNNYDNKGLRFLLSLIGDPDEIILEWEKQKHLPPVENMDFGTNLSLALESPPKQQQYLAAHPIAGTKQSMAGSMASMPRVGEIDPGSELIKPLSLPKNLDWGNDSINDRVSARISPKGTVGTIDDKIANYFRDGEMPSSKNKAVSEAFAQDFFKNMLKEQDDTIDDLLDMPTIGRKGGKDGSQERVDPRAKVGVRKKVVSKLMNKKSTSPVTALAFMKALEDIDEIKRRNQEKNIERDLVSELNSLKEQKLKEALKRKLEQRRLELGINAKVNNYVEPSLLINHENTFQAKKKAKDGHEIMLIDLDEEEAFQKDSINVFLRKNIKKYKYIFNKYCSTSANFEKTKNFEKARFQSTTLNLVELNKLVKENNLSPYISKDEVQQLLRQVNFKLLRKSEQEPLTFEGFTKWVTQAAIHMFTRPPGDQINFNYINCLQKFFDLIYLSAKERGEHRLLVEDWELYPETQELAQLNRRLQDQPSMDVPDGYKKILDNTVEFKPNLPVGIIPEAHAMAYDIIGGILKEQFGIQLFENKAVFNTMLKIVPNPKPEVHLLKRGPKNDRTNNDRFRDVSRSLEAKFGARDASIISSPERMNGKFMNKAIEERLRRDEEERVKKEMIDKKIMKRKLELDTRKKELQDQKQEKRYKQEEEERKAQQDKIELEKKMEMRKKQELELKKKMIKEHKEKRAQEIQSKEDEDKDQRFKILQEARREREEFLKKQRAAYKDQFDKKKAEREKEEENKREREESEKLRIEKMKKKAEKGFEKDYQKRDNEKKANERLNECFKSPDFKQVFDKYQKQLQKLFKHFKEDMGSEEMSYKNFMQFAGQMNVFPSLIKAEQLNLLFKSVTKEKKKSMNTITYEEFLQCLLRISAKGQLVLDSIYDRYSTVQREEGFEAKQQQEIHDMVNDALKADGEETYTNEQANKIKQQNANYELNSVGKDKVDLYANIDTLSPKTVEGLMFYLDIPTNPKVMADKLQSIRTVNQRLNPREKRMAAINKARGDTLSQSPDQTSKIENANAKKSSIILK